MTVLEAIRNTPSCSFRPVAAARAGLGAKLATAGLDSACKST
jgi:hypothetical protein